MFQSGSAAGHNDSQVFVEGDAMTLSRLRHDIRNYLNTIKLSTALIQRQRIEKPASDSLREIDKAADSINELVSRFLGDDDAPGLFSANDSESTGK